MFAYDVNGNFIAGFPQVVGDGVTDDTVAVQSAVNNYPSIRFPSGLKIRLTAPVNIDISRCHTFDGGNSTFIIDGDFTAFNIVGSVTASMVATPDTLTDQIIKDEAAFRFVNCRVTSASQKDGVGVSLSGCFKTIIEGCYLYYLHTGIVLKNQLRDLIIYGNQIYASWMYGIHIQSTANIHQFNINNNVLTYNRYGIFIDNPIQIANLQVTGNDIEISTYPGISDKTGFRCIYVVSGDTQSGQLSEIEICGNTIQGHSVSNGVIDISGGANRYVMHLSVVGNHISNSLSNAIKLTKVKTASFCGNSYKDVTANIYNIANCDRITIIGESANNVNGLATVDSASTNIITANNNV